MHHTLATGAQSSFLNCEAAPKCIHLQWTYMVHMTLIIQASKNSNLMSVTITQGEYSQKRPVLVTLPKHGLVSIINEHKASILLILRLRSNFIICIMRSPKLLTDVGLYNSVYSFHVCICLICLYTAFITF